MVSDIKKCRICGKLFRPIRSNVCHDCLEKKEEAYKTVRDYLYDNADADIKQIEEGTGIDAKLILEFLRDGRISVEDEGLMFNCTRCGKSISESGYCEPCKQKLADEMEKFGSPLNGANSSNSALDGTSPKKKKSSMHIKYNK